MTESPVVTVLVDRCAGCQECVVRCPTAALSMDTDNWVAQADSTLCVGCRQCVRTCPFSAIEVEGPMMVAERATLAEWHPEKLLGDYGEIRQGITSLDVAQAEAERCLDCPDPTCMRGCPAHNDIPGFIAEVRLGNLAAANEILSRTSMLPDVCSRVCDQAVQCEGSCSWSLAGGKAVAIGALERFVTEHAAVPAPAAPGQEASGRGLDIGIVGSGPAGIAAAWELVQAGAAVTVYEKESKPGGLIRWGIPDFTLPTEIEQRPWEQLEAAGVTLHCGAGIKPEHLENLLKAHDGIIMAYGAGAPLRLPIEGADLDGVIDATMFLTEGRRALREHRPMPLLTEIQERLERPVRVLVLGAGNTAMDVARTARRLGAEASCVDWMDRRFAPVRPDELAEAEQEGVKVLFSTTVEAVVGAAGFVEGARIVKTEQRDASHKPESVPNSAREIPADLVVMAMGYRIDPSVGAMAPGTPFRKTTPALVDREWQASGILANPAPSFARHQAVGKLAVARESALSIAALPVAERCWVAGDALVGPSTVVEAMAHGRRAALSLLEARPQRSSQNQSAPRNVLIAYDSRGGNTRKAAEQMAESLGLLAEQVRVLPISKVGPTELALAELVILGTWVEGMVVTAVAPAKTTVRWLKSLPAMANKHFAVFCTYGFSPKGALDTLVSVLEAKGATVVAKAAIAPHGVGIDTLVKEVRDAAWPEVVPSELAGLAVRLGFLPDRDASARALYRAAGGRVESLDKARLEIVNSLRQNPKATDASAGLVVILRSLALAGKPTHAA